MTQLTKFGSVNLEENPKLGFYSVGNKIYFSKVQALIESTKTGEFPVWNFNNEVYNKQDWLTIPEVDLRELYRQRAQQLRDRYDYIRLESSGGSDSTQVIFSFLLNGIHLDEIVFRYPKAGEKDLPVDPRTWQCENTLSEYEFATRPLLNWVKTNYPQVKITVHDYSADMLVDEDRDESWVYSAKEFLQPGHVTKFPNYQTIEHKYLADGGRTICVLYGIDKPKMCIKEGQWYLYFMDFQANYANPDVGDYTNITNEYFYWTPDFPEISVKQAQIVRQWFNMPANRHLQHLVNWPNHSVAQRTTYEQIIKPLIYPNYDHQTFQVSKPSSNFYSEMDYWFYENFKDHKLYSSWLAGIDFVERNVDKKFFNKKFNQPVGFVGFLSPFYNLGPVDPGIKTPNKFDIKIADRKWD
jgi:hypothetical protein